MYQNSSRKLDNGEYRNDYLTKELDESNGTLKTEEYRQQLFNLEQRIIVLRNDLHDQTIKNSDLEKKLEECSAIDRNNEIETESNKVNIIKIYELEVLLKESRKQNVTYADELKELRRKETNRLRVDEEMSYLKNENTTLKAYIVAQNNMTHYRHAFGNIKFEQYCPRCSESIKEECTKSSGNDRLSDSSVAEKDIQVPEVNKTGHRNVVKILKNSSTYTIQLNNNGDGTESLDKKDPKSRNQVLPTVNKTNLRKIVEKIDVPVDSLDSVVRTMIHLGDQVLIGVEWSADNPVRATVKYIGNLEGRYQYRLFLGVKLSVKPSDIPHEYHNDGWFRNRRYFTLNTINGYFLHFSNIVSILNKETAHFEDFGEFLLRKIDPTANRNRRKNDSIKGLNGE